ncbi:MAG TPA: transglutaminase-like domain-containing protein, partial [Myxococcota bacterium]|nr:transglutaminase-like domain-containing protein [Myxococcota bacterium]
APPAAVVPAPPPPVAPVAPATVSRPEPYDYYYGVYVSGQKVGWMRSVLEAGAAVRLTTELHAKVSGMGQVADLALTEDRTYDAKSGVLQRLSFVQAAESSEVKVLGSRQGEGEQMSLEITAGGQPRTQVVKVNERLDDALVLSRLSKTPKVGAKAESVHFDPSIQKVTKVQHVVQAVEKRMLGGVEAKTVKIASTYPDLGVTETAWLDTTGKVLESQIGGAFVARLEPPEVAKKLDFHEDLLVSQVVRAPRVITEPHNLQKLGLKFTGFGDALPPASSRQTVTQEAGAVTLALRKDPPPARQPLGQGVPEGPEARAVKEALEPTAFIQSDAPELVAAAKKAIGNAQDVFTASTRLVQFVVKHMRSEYVPAYSNALDSFKMARGDCTEHSILYVALARAVGIPARVAVGIAYWPPGDGFGWHAWAEIYVGGTWIAVDPTWNQPIADATHVKLADGGPAEQARIVMLLGQLKIVDMQT